MKKLLFYVAGLAFIMNSSSCKKGNDSNETTTVTVTDSIEVERTTDTKASDTTKKRLSNKSFNELLKLYNVTKNQKTIDAKYLQLILDEIEDGRLILPDEYTTITETFWGKGVDPLTKKMSKNDITVMIGNAKDTDYIEFTFTDKKDAVFIDKIVSKHSFDTKQSCFPALIFKKMLKDADFELLEITKSKKTFKNPPSKYDGDYLMAVMKYTDKKGKVQHFDIVDDPTIY